MVRITVELENGHLATGAGFHIGEGVFATARHVIHGHRSIKVEHTAGFGMINSVEIRSIILPSDPDVDVALLKTDIHFTQYFLSGYKSSPGQTLADFSSIPLGDLIDEAVSDDHILDEALLMGFPKIPLSDAPELVAVRGEINASIRSYLGPRHYLHVISTVARGGFSGGPVIDSNGFLLGIFTQALLQDGQETELGFAAVASIQPLLELLKQHHIDLPDNLNVLISDEAEYSAWYEKRKDVMVQSEWTPRSGFLPTRTRRA